MSKVDIANQAKLYTWDYESDQEEDWMRTLIEYTLRPWKYRFGFRTN